MGFVDTVMVGRLGSEALAGVALGNTAFYLVFIVCTGIVMAVGPMVSQAYGAETLEPIGRSVRQGLWLGTTLAIPAMLVLTQIAPLWHWLDQPPQTVEIAQAYLRAIAWGLPPVLWFMALRSFVESVSRPWPVTAITACAVVLNVGANYVLMFGHFGFPRLGLVGTGWASTIVFWLMFVALFTYVRLQPRFRRFRLFERFGTPDTTYFRELLRIGWPIGVSYGIEAGLFVITALLIGTLGSTQLAAHQVAIQCAAFTFMVPLGIGIAASVRVGQAVGRKDADGVRWAGLVGLGLSAVFMLVAAVVFWVAPRTIVGLYLDLDAPANQDVVRLAVSLLGIAAVFQLFDGVQVTAAGALRGLKDTRVPMVLSFCTYWLVGLTSGYVLGLRMGGGATGLWWGLVLGLAAAAIVLSARFLRQSRRATAGTLPTFAP